MRKTTLLALQFHQRGSSSQLVGQRRGTPLGQDPTRARGAGSPLVTKLTRASTIQIALRLLTPDLAKARERAQRKGIGYQTLLKMIVHEGLRHVERQAG